MPHAPCARAGRALPPEPPSDEDAVSCLVPRICVRYTFVAVQTWVIVAS
jgi:hypothetical protein